MTKTKKRLLIITALSLALILIILGACAIYLSDYYRADADAIAVFAPDEDIYSATLDDGSVLFEPKGATVGFIFYPGGKVEHNAYQPLMAALAREGVLSVLVEMPFNLAVFDVNAADGIREKYPEIESWYIGGHSLGGSMAASYLLGHEDEYEGLILLGAYSTADLSDTELDVLSVYGSEDLVMNREKYDGYKANLPKTFTEIIIDGGCHAHFGSYGAQKGDGIPTISSDEQVAITVEAIMSFMQ